MIPSFRLSVAELASVMALCGNIEAAYGYLQTALGDIQPDQVNVWLTAGGHALIARDLLHALPDGRFGELNSDLQQVTRTLLQDDNVLRCHRTGLFNGESFEQFVNLVFADSLIIAHWIEQRVVAMTTPLLTVTDAYSHLAAFIGSQGSQSQISRDWSDQQELPLRLLGDLRQAATQKSPTELEPWLRQYLRGAWVKALASTLTDPTVMWGDVLRIERQAGEITAERGFLFASAKGMAWLFALGSADNSSVKVMPASLDRISQCCRDALS